MISSLEKTNKSDHDPNDYNDPVAVPEVDFNDETDDDDDLYIEKERMLFFKSLKPVGNSFALVCKSNGDPTFLMYEGLSDHGVNDPDRRFTRSVTRKIRGSNALSRDVSPCGLSKKRENDQNKGADTRRRAGLSQRVRRPKRKTNPRVVKNVGAAEPRKVGLNCLSYSLRPRKKQKPSVSKNVSDDGRSGSSDQDNGDDTGEVGSNCLSRNISLRRNRNHRVVKNVNGDCFDRVNEWRAKRSKVGAWRNRRDLANGDHSWKVDKRRARRLRGSRYRSGLAKKRKNDQHNGAEIESSCIVEAQGGQGNGAEKERRICVIGIQHDQGNGAEKERSRCVIGTQHDQGTGAEKEISVKIEYQDDQDYVDSNRAYHIWLKNYDVNICDFGNGNVETSSDSELEVLDKDPQCSEWKYIPLADSNVLDATIQMEEEDVQYMGECSKPENPQFRKDVEDILRRPYDEKEYETLWLQVNSRKPMQGYRELRGHLKAYSKDTMGKSYLDEYLDLRRKLDTFETDLPRKLNVLRGFFYYMKNIANDGTFKPWLDESCLAIVPGFE